MAQTLVVRLGRGSESYWRLRPLVLELGAQLVCAIEQPRNEPLFGDLERLLSGYGTGIQRPGQGNREVAHGALLGPSQGGRKGRRAGLRGPQAVRRAWLRAYCSLPVKQVDKTR